MAIIDSFESLKLCYENHWKHFEKIIESAPISQLRSGKCPACAGVGEVEVLIVQVRAELWAVLGNAGVQGSTGKGDPLNPGQSRVPPEIFSDAKYFLSQGEGKYFLNNISYWK